ncbi:MAG: YcnI family protein [Leifsonia flava]
MKTTTRTTALAASALGAGLLFALASPLAASAHVGVTPDSTAAGSYTVLTFAVPHGCDGSSTTAVAIDIPESIPSVTPTVNQGWTVEKSTITLDPPVTDAHGNELTERVGQVVYTAKTPLADGYRDTFALSLQLPEDAAGDTLEFPVTQTCEVGSTLWNEKTVDGEAEPEHPAPAITVTEAAGDAHGHSDSADAAASSEHDDASSTTDAAEVDVLARVLGVLGLVVGAVGVVIAVVSRRRVPAGK